MNVFRTSSLAAAAVAATVASQACSAPDGARAQSLPAPEVRGAAHPDLDDVATLRAEGPAALERLLAEHDAARGADRERLAAAVDRVAAQRYATVSRLFWYTDLAAARAAARASGKPILSLRLLGRLDEDLSCANSRFFRVALYGNAELSRWLRDHFVLHWSSERPVPTLTIDFGDGRQLETTIAGNSAHYVLDADGNVLDIIPGLMTPRAFRHELEGSLELALQILAADSVSPGELIARHHDARLAALGETWKQLGNITIPAPPSTTAIAGAEALAVTKARVEVPVVKIAALGATPSAVPADSTAWRPIGIHALRALGLESTEAAGRVLPTPRVLDEQSRALLAALAPTDWSRPGEPLEAAGIEALTAAFESSIVADTGQNLLRLRTAIHAALSAFARDGELDFDRVNGWLYASLFLTPKDDPWLGMSTPGAFTGLPGDGVVARR